MFSAPSWGSRIMGRGCIRDKQESIDVFMFIPFLQEREEFTKKIITERYPNDHTKTTLTADEMSEFYKSFLDRKWSTHLHYNIEWQKRNFTILILSILVGIENVAKKLQCLVVHSFFETYFGKQNRKIKVYNEEIKTRQVSANIALVVNIVRFYKYCSQ